jgi:hypothetical protein
MILTQNVIFSVTRCGVWTLNFPPENGLQYVLNLTQNVVIILKFFSVKTTELRKNQKKNSNLKVLTGTSSSSLRVKSSKTVYIGSTLSVLIFLRG